MGVGDREGSICEKGPQLELNQGRYGYMALALTPRPSQHFF